MYEGFYQGCVEQWKKKQRRIDEKRKESIGGVKKDGKGIEKL